MEESVDNLHHLIVNAGLIGLRDYLSFFIFNRFEKVGNAGGDRQSSAFQIVDEFGNR